MIQRTLSTLLLGIGTLAAVAAHTTTAHAQTADTGHLRDDSEHPLSLGLRGSGWDASHLSGVSGGFDLAYSLNPYFAVGAQQLFHAGYSGVEYHPLEIHSGFSTLALAEVRYPALSFLAPYARAEVGISRFKLEADLPGVLPETRNPLALGAELGVELHYRVSVRVFANLLAHPEIGERARFAGGGLQLGFRF